MRNGVYRGTLALMMVVCATHAVAGAQTGSGDPADTLVLLDEQGQAVALHEVVFPGPVLVIFWRPDSRPSREAVIHLHQCRDRVRHRGLRLVGVVPTDTDCSAAQDFLFAQGVEFRNLCDRDWRVAEHFGMGSIVPSLLLLDREGRPVERAAGGGDSFDTNLEQLMEAAGEIPRPDVSGRWWVVAALVGVMILGMGIVVTR